MRRLDLQTVEARVPKARVEGRQPPACLAQRAVQVLQAQPVMRVRLAAQVKQPMGKVLCLELVLHLALRMRRATLASRAIRTAAFLAQVKEIRQQVTRAATPRRPLGALRGRLVAQAQVTQRALRKTVELAQATRAKTLVAMGVRRLETPRTRGAFRPRLKAVRAQARAMVAFWVGKAEQVARLRLLEPMETLSPLGRRTAEF